MESVVSKHLWELSKRSDKSLSVKSFGSIQIELIDVCVGDGGFSSYDGIFCYVGWLIKEKFEY